MGAEKQHINANEILLAPESKCMHFVFFESTSKVVALFPDYEKTETWKSYMNFL